MKDIKCPLCGKELRLKWSPSTHYHVGCGYCGWETSKDRGAPEMAWKDAEEFISKLPPIMRIKAGDNVKIYYDDDIFTVVSVNIDELKTMIEEGGASND